MRWRRTAEVRFEYIHEQLEDRRLELDVRRRHALHLRHDDRRHAGRAGAEADRRLARACATSTASSSFCNNRPVLEARDLECERGGRMLFRGLAFALAAGRAAARRRAERQRQDQPAADPVRPAHADARAKCAGTARRIQSLQRGVRAPRSCTSGHAPAVKDELTGAENLRAACALAGLAPSAAADARCAGALRRAGRQAGAPALAGPAAARGARAAGAELAGAALAARRAVHRARRRRRPSSRARCSASTRSAAAAWSTARTRTPACATAA